MKSTIAVALALTAFVACTSTTKGEGPSSSSSTSSSTSSGSTSTTSSSSSGGSVSAARCNSVCLSKVNECNPDSPDKFTQCQDLCRAGSFTDGQLNCFQSASCADLQNATFLEDVCPP